MQVHNEVDPGDLVLFPSYLMHAVPPNLGERRISMRLWLDPAKLAAYRVTPADVEDALRRQNVEIPAGRIESNARELVAV